MHPAPSIVVFTVLSGLGFGLIAWLGAGATAAEGWRAAALAALAAGLVAAGLLASLAHLGQPRRFLKAFSQWRSSWLSREAVLAVAALAVFGPYAALWALAGLRPTPLGWAAAALALGCVAATSMIYAQMRTVPRWRSPLTPAVFLLAALAGGALASEERAAAPALLAALAIAQVADWALGDRRLRASGSDLATATGLGRFGALRTFAPPHTGANYLTREMVFVVGRRHAAALRVGGLVLAALAPLAGMLAAPPGAVAAAVMLVSHLAGMLVLRWLFFAEAEHVVGLYYGRR